MKQWHKLLIAGGVIGLASVILVIMGNPANMGFCIACFLRDTAGALGAHNAEAVQYIRPEIIGLVLGAFGISIFKKEFSARGGSSAFTRFVLGFLVMICALVFLGCPLRMVLRIAGGDLNAVVGLVGFTAGIGVGALFLNKGFSLKRTYKQPKVEGMIMPLLQLASLALLVFAPAFVLFSQKGPGSMHAPIWAALIAGLVVGAICQRTRMCMVGGLRDVLLFKDFTLLLGFVAIFVVVLISNLITGSFSLSFVGQPIAHVNTLWNFLSMVCVGLGCVLLGGCPLRQLILAGEGNTDSALTVMGMFAGAAIAHNFKLASSASVLQENGAFSGGVTVGGKVAVIVSFLIMILIAYLNTKEKKHENN